MTANLLTFDIEHWYESYRYRGLSGWEDLPPHDDRIVLEIFDLLAQHNQKATCFFTGRFAREFPDLVRRCAALGHEVASHSFEHKLITRMDGPDEFRSDLRQSIDTLSQITGNAVLGFRAPKWSVTPQNQKWVLRILSEEGLQYDSSFFPATGADPTRRDGRAFKVDLDHGFQIIEVPATGLNMGPFCLPISGGLYFRASPTMLTEWMLNQKIKSARHGMLYFHPFDLDANGPRLAGGGVLFQLFRAVGVKSAIKKLSRILHQYRFSSIRDWLVGQQIALPARRICDF